jgi:DNA protecting protein DprA
MRERVSCGGFRGAPGQPPAMLNRRPRGDWTVQESALPELPRGAALWAMANEKRHWSPEDIASFRADGENLVKALWGARGRQIKLPDSERLVVGAALGMLVGLVAKRRRETAEGAEELRALAALMAMALSGVTLLPLNSPEYPHRLSTISNPPLILYAVGALFRFEKCVGISGTRKPSQWGRKTAERLGRRLAQDRWVVTSGLAKGIDSSAHRGALSAKGGLTVAVSALPLNRVYPPENTGLARMIAHRGTIVSEHGLAAGAGKVEFLRRNRIISGLSVAQFIVECHGGGGTRQQAETALAQKRPVFVMRPPPAEREAREGFEVLCSLGAEPASSVEEGLRVTREAWGTALE